MDATEIITKLGGTAKTAELCDISPGAVSQWKRNGIPKPQLNFLRLARPDIFLVDGAKNPKKGRRSTDPKQNDKKEAV